MSLSLTTGVTVQTPGMETVAMVIVATACHDSGLTLEAKLYKKK